MTPQDMIEIFEDTRRIFRSDPYLRHRTEEAMANEVDILILGAFGCGAFHNNPRLMSRAFADLLLREKYAAFFRRVFFAIKPTTGFCPNVYAFAKEFDAI